MQIREVGSGAPQRQWGRSVTDFLVTVQELEHLGVGFVSLTEALDLTTAAGRAMADLGNLRGVRTGNPAETHAPVSRRREGE